MRVAFYYRFLGLGGVESVILNRLAPLKRVGIQAEWWFSEFYGTGARYLAERPDVHRIDIPSDEFSSAVAGVDALVAIDNPELIEVVTKTGPVKQAVVYETHASYPPALRRYYAVLNNPLIGAVVVPSAFNRQLICETGFGRCDPIVIPNCLSPELDAQEDELPTELSKLASPVLLWVGRLEDEKNPKELLEIYATLQTRWENLHLLVIGDTPEYEKYLDRLRGGGVRTDWPNATFLQQVPFERMRGVYRLVARSGGVLISTSSYESAPMTFLEAMAVGCPVVSSRVGGVPELLGDDEFGMMYPPGDVKRACSVIGRLLEDGGGRAELSERARERVDRRHNPVVVARRYRDVLEHL